MGNSAATMPHASSEAPPETTTLLLVADEAGGDSYSSFQSSGPEVTKSSSSPTPSMTIASAATTSDKWVGTILLASQVTFVFLFFFGTSSYNSSGGGKEQDDDTVPVSVYDVKEYIAFRDIMAMLLLGFGYLMTFLKHYGLGAVGFTMMLSVLAMEANVFVELAMRFLYYGGADGEDTSLPLSLTMANLIDAEFAAATFMISFGALIGNATPLQLIILCLGQSFCYAFNKVILVLGLCGAEDVGGSMTIHMFGAYFGLAASYAIGPPQESIEAGEPDKVSDLLALIGTTILWVFWPSFVGATETGTPDYEQKCVINTICALLASTSVTFYLSHKWTGHKFDPVHIANSTLAGGVAIGSSGRLNIGPGWAFLVGTLAGTASVWGYVVSSPYLATKFRIHDTCGVGNLHGYPSLVGGLLSVVLVALDPAASFLQYSLASQMFRQLGGVVVTLVAAMASGYGLGRAVQPLKPDKTPCFLDSAFWHSEYFGH